VFYSFPLSIFIQLQVVFEYFPEYNNNNNNNNIKNAKLNGAKNAISESFSAFFP
jgi:hypothetical protein